VKGIYSSVCKSSVKVFLGLWILVGIYLLNTWKLKYVEDFGFGGLVKKKGVL
jgi:hypothetical protein